MGDLFLISDTGQNTLEFVILTFIAGIILACFVMLYQIKVPGKIVRALLRAQAISEQSAVGTDVIGFQNERLLRFLLKDTGALAKYVRVIPNKEIRAGKRILPEYATARYYLEPSTKVRASIRYDRHRASVPALIAAIILFTAVGFALTYVIPDLVQMTENFVNSIKDSIK